MNKNDIERFGKEGFSQVEIEKFGCDPKDEFSRAIRRISILIMVYVEQIVDDLGRIFSSTKLRKNSTGRKVDYDLNDYIDKRVVDAVHNINSQYYIKKPFVPFIFTSLSMLNSKYSIELEALVVRIIDTHFYLNKFKHGDINARNELVKRKLIIGG